MPTRRDAMVGGVRDAQPMRNGIGRADHGLTSPFSGANVGHSSNQGDRFANLLLGEVKQVNDMQLTADANVHAMLTGGDVNQAEVLTSVQKADLAFRMLLQVRNKMMEAYREIQQIQI